MKMQMSRSKAIAFGIGLLVLSQVAFAEDEILPDIAHAMQIEAIQSFKAICLDTDFDPKAILGAWSRIAPNADNQIEKDQDSVWLRLYQMQESHTESFESYKKRLNGKWQYFIFSQGLSKFQKQFGNDSFANNYLLHVMRKKGEARAD